MIERKELLITKLHKMGVYYKNNQDIEKLSLPELEYLHVTEKCKLADAILTQRGLI